MLLSVPCRWMLHRGRCIVRAEDGEPVHFVGTHTDVTERKQVHGAIVAASNATRRLRAAEAGENLSRVHHMVHGSCLGYDTNAPIELCPGEGHDPRNTLGGD